MGAGRRRRGRKGNLSIQMVHTHTRVAMETVERMVLCFCDLFQAVIRCHGECFGGTNIELALNYIIND